MSEIDERVARFLLANGFQFSARGNRFAWYQQVDDGSRNGPGAAYVRLVDSRVWPMSGGVAQIETRAILTLEETMSTGEAVDKRGHAWEMADPNGV